MIHGRVINTQITLPPTSDTIVYHIVYQELTVYEPEVIFLRLLTPVFCEGITTTFIPVYCIDFSLQQPWKI
jgi:hypothetical protein